MRALAVTPGQLSTATVEDRPDPPAGDGAVLVEGLLMGVCGTDVEIARDGYGELPAGAQVLVLGHESLGRVLEAPADSGLAAGDLVAGVVRRPDPVPCPWCAVGEWDMCANGRYVERGIKARDGYGATRWRADPHFVIKVDARLGDAGVLLEPTSVVAKAWEQTERIGHRATYAPRTALVTGAGPIGLLAAMIGVQRGLQVHVLDQVPSGRKPELVAALGATYHHDGVAGLGFRPDVVIEGTGYGPLIVELLAHLAPNAIMALTGIMSDQRQIPVPMDALNKALVLGNAVVFGSVNAAHRHYEQAAEALASADQPWLAQLITRRVPLADWPTALDKTPEDVKVVIDLQG